MLELRCNVYAKYTFTTILKYTEKPVKNVSIPIKMYEK